MFPQPFRSVRPKVRVKRLNVNDLNGEEGQQKVLLGKLSRMLGRDSAEDSCLTITVAKLDVGEGAGKDQGKTRKTEGFHGQIRLLYFQDTDTGHRGCFGL